LNGNPEWKRLVARLRLRLEKNIKFYLREIGVEVTDWVHLAQDRHSIGLL
jgi:hypothetical protein